MEKIPYLLELELPFVPRRLNEVLRQFRLTRNDEFKEVYEWMRLLTLNKRPHFPLGQCQITIIRKVSKDRFLDWDNMVASYKPVIDGLVHANILMDDTYDITGPWTVTQELRPKKEGAVTYLRIEGWHPATPQPFQRKIKKVKNDVPKSRGPSRAKNKRPPGRHDRISPKSPYTRKTNTDYLDLDTTDEYARLEENPA